MIAPTAPRPSLWQILALVAIGVWTVALTVASQLSLYVADLAFTAQRGALAPDWIAVMITSVVGMLIAAPAAAVGWLARPPGIRAVGRLLAWAGVAFVMLGAARLVPAAHHELYLAVLAASATIVGIRLRRRGSELSTRRGRLGAWAGGLALLTVWAWFGALGGPLETVAAGAAAAAVGWLAGRLLARVGFDGTFPTRILLTGVVYTAALVPLAGAVGESGVSLAELVVLPPLGFAAAALRRDCGRLIALAAAGPLLFVDPEETSALLGTSDVGYWTVVAAAVAFFVGLLVDGGLAVSYGRGLPPPATVTAALVALLAVGLGAVYFGAGQPGLHGEQLFVVLRQQADLTGVASIADRDQRLAETYRRLVDTAERTQASLRRDLSRLRVGFRPYYLVNGLAVDGGPAVRAWLDRRSDVDRVLLDPVLRPLPAAPEPLRGRAAPPTGPQWNIELIGAGRVWAELNVRGAGVVIGASDSGVDGAHPALSGSFRGGDDSWYDPWNGSRVPVDRNGHGTHTLGSALGAGGIGVAPQARWVGCVNLDRNLGSPSHYLECLQYMLAPFPRGGDPLRDGRPARAPHVLTNSWGCPELEGCDGRVLRPAVAALTAAGIFFVAAAGNTGPSCGSLADEPATSADAFTVGAVNGSRALADFSSRRGGEPDVVAPGVDVWSALPGGGYGALSGTSMAAPHVAGVVALMWSANPRLIGDVARTADLLRSRVQPLAPDACDPDPTRLVDAYAAVRAAQEAA
jgi:hypothetical protein